MQTKNELVVAIRTQVAGIGESMQSLRFAVDGMQRMASVEIAANLAEIDISALRNSAQSVRDAFSGVLAQTMVQSAKEFGGILQNARREFTDYGMNVRDTMRESALRFSDYIRENFPKEELMTRARDTADTIKNGAKFLSENVKNAFSQARENRGQGNLAERIRNADLAEKISSVKERIPPGVTEEIMSRATALRERFGSGSGNFAGRLQTVQNLRPMIEQGIAGGRELFGQGETAIRGAQERFSMENTENTLKEMLNVLISMRDGERMQLQFERDV